MPLRSAGSHLQVTDALKADVAAAKEAAAEALAMTDEEKEAKMSRIPAEFRKAMQVSIGSSSSCQA